jgi:hypothetical protein
MAEEFKGKDILIKTDGEIHTLDIPEKNYKLEDLQHWVEGYLEEIPCFFSRKHVGLVNEDGTRLGLEYNAAASEMFGHMLVGPVLVVSRDKMGGDGD